LENPTFLKCYGISKDAASKNYIIVIEYAPMGSLKENLNSIKQMKWKDKLTLLHSIAFDLQIIHSKNYIHRDLHSGNVLLNNLTSAYIANLGLLMPTNIMLEKQSDKFYGVLPYVAPEVLSKNKYAMASDIYSFGMIMWEVFSGRRLFSEREYITNLQFDICNGLRPTISSNMAQCYIDLMKKCWDDDLKKRPSAADICEIFEIWKYDKTYQLQFIESDDKMSANKAKTTQNLSLNKTIQNVSLNKTHTGAIHTTISSLTNSIKYKERINSLPSQGNTINLEDIKEK
ncbi:kinase-like domain-containing protein, partial [Gigaspora rosea]